MTGRPRLVIFDVDGTLVDSQGQIHAAMCGAFALAGLSPPDLASTLSIVGLSLPVAVARLAEGQDAATRDRIVSAYRDGFAAARAQAPAALYPGARAALDALSARAAVQLGIATGKSRRGLQHVLAAQGLEGRFQTAQVADDHPSKPHPSMVLAALDACGVAAADAVMVGDTEFDIRMARAAGVPAIGVGWGYHPAEELHRAGASAVIGHFDDLAPALDRLWGRA